MARQTERDEVTQVSASQVYAVDYERQLIRDALEVEQRSALRAARTRAVFLEYLILRCPEESWPSKRGSR